MLEGVFWLNTMSVSDPFQAVDSLQESELEFLVLLVALDPVFLDVTLAGPVLLI